MAIAKTRIIYTQGSALIDGAASADIKSVQNATLNITVPRENVNAFGVTGTVDRPQLAADDVSLEFSYIPLASNAAGDMDGTELEKLKDETVKGTPTYSSADCAGIGKVKLALMNSFGSEAAVGAMPTNTISFTGIKDTSANPNGIEPVQNSTLTLDMTQPEDIELAASLGTATSTPCAQSASIAWDCPVEIILCLDDAVTDGSAFGNPPGTASITVEQLSESLGSNTGGVAASYALTIGVFTYTLSGARVDSATNSMAVGDLFATYNYVIGGTADGVVVS
jgi:hypothetical protein